MKKIERVEAIDSREYRFIKATAPKIPNWATEVVRAKVLEHKRGGKSDTKQGRRSNGNRNGTGDQIGRKTKSGSHTLAARMEIFWIYSANRSHNRWWFGGLNVPSVGTPEGLDAQRGERLQYTPHSFGLSGGP